MKHLGTIIVILFAVSVAGGCGPTQEEYDKKVKEADDLRAELADYDRRIKELEELNAELQKTLDESCGDQSELIAELKKKEKQAQKRLAMFTEMLEKFKSLIEAGKLKVKIRDGKMLLELPSAVLFKSGKAVLSDDGKATLTEVAPVLASIKNREFQVAGHTDNQPIKKSQFTSNWQLSTERALSVVEFLQENGVKPKNLSVAGYSQYQPVAKNASPGGKAANRRIEIVVMPDLDELPNLDKLEKMLEESEPKKPKEAKAAKESKKSKTD